MNERRKPYPFDRIEPKWQAIWDENRAFHAPNPGEENFDPAKPKYYVLDMFPYPSGAGLHVGHPEGYTATDIIARYKRLRGFNVLHPMGWDAFGLPAEQYAIKTGQHPAITTRDNVAKFKAQLKRIGFSYDWEREVNTTDPAYYKWTQWIFLQIYNSWFNPETKKAEPISTYRGDDPDSVRLAYVAEVPVNWCQELGTVLANEEVIDGKSEVGGFPVVRRPMRQWMLRITAFAERLLDELEGLDWPDSIKALQRNWIGRSEGAEIVFTIAREGEALAEPKAGGSAGASPSQLRSNADIRSSRRGPTRCMAPPTWCSRRKTRSSIKLSLLNSGPWSKHTALPWQRNPISNARIWPRKKRACSPAHSQSIRPATNAFQSGSLITF